MYRYACSLLVQGMKQIVITLDSPDITAVEKLSDREAIIKVESLYDLHYESGPGAFGT